MKGVGNADAGYWFLDTGYRILDTGYWMRVTDICLDYQEIIINVYV